ncbi:MAG: hypothetical protein ACTSR8_14155 [Promethearchaeota archaeon]
MMITPNQITDEFTVIDEVWFTSVNKALHSLQDKVKIDLLQELEIPFHVRRDRKCKKINPILCIANSEDALYIVNLYKELYNGTYPYKEMEDIEAIRSILESADYKCVLFKTPNGDYAGCVKFSLDFIQKKGYIRGFMVSKKYQGKIDVIKAFMGSMLGMWMRYHDKILVWYVENRTAHSKSQYTMRLCGLYPIGFYPNKDIFLNKVESDLMQIIYDEKALKELRRKKPQIILEAESVYKFSNERYHLGEYSLIKPKIEIDSKKLVEIKNKLIVDIHEDKYGYQTYILSLKGIKSYLKFLYTPQVQNFEKTEYSVNSLEELFVFAQEFIRIGRKLKIRYCEIFISAYEPEHQQIFNDVGLTPRGYIPSWKYCNSINLFEDHILFNFFKGKIDEKIHIIKEAKILLRVLEVL